jgi:ABC-2 type transport system permease protein
MLTLLKIEWLKVKKYRAFWIIFSFLIILFPAVTMALGKVLKNGDQAGMGETILGGPFDFPTVFYNAAYVCNGLNIAWGMLIILMIGNEFQNRTIRQNVIDGQQRNEVVTSKIILVVIFSFISATLLMVSGLLTGVIYAHNSFSFSIDMLKVYGIFFFASFMQMLFALLFGFFIKRPALSVILYLGYTVFIENVLWLIMVAIFKNNYPRLLFTQAADELTTITLSENKILYAPFDPPAQEAPWIACVIYAAMIMFFLYRYINRTILK